MWAIDGDSAKGEWSFMQSCQDDAHTTSVSSDPAAPCNQDLTINSPIGAHGTSLTVGPSFQLSYSSLPFMAAGKLEGLTLKKQFQKAFKEHAAGTLDYLMVGTFNEHIAQPQPNPYFSANAAAQSMGMPLDPFAKNLWVDMYGDGVTRDLEPTKADGGRMWNLFLSCMRVFWGLNSTCSSLNEACCDFADPLTAWANIWALRRGDQDYLLTADEGERNALVTEGWTELCSPFGGSSVFCAPAEPYDATQYVRGALLICVYPSRPPSLPHFR